jgi:hypothetical protein
MIKIKQLFHRWLFQLLHARRDQVVVRCDGWLPGAEGVKPCFKEITLGEAIKVYFSRNGQIHDLHFCSLPCMEGWQKEATRCHTQKTN